MSERYKCGLLCWDLGLDSGLGGKENPLLLDVTTRGIAFVQDGQVLGFVSPDELRAVVDAADKRCPTCGAYKDRTDLFEAIARERWHYLGQALSDEPVSSRSDPETLKRILRRTLGLGL